MILAINTAQALHELALIDDGITPEVHGESASKVEPHAEILAEEIWPNNKNDVEELVPKLKKMLEELGLSKEDINEIVVAAGPGPYTAIRTGVTFANALAAGLDAKLYVLDTYDLLNRKAATADPVIIVTNAGGLDVGVRAQIHGEQGKLAGLEPVKVGPMSELLADFEHHKYTVVAEVTESQKTELHGICLEKNWKEVEGEKLQTFGEAILTFGLKDIQQVESVEAIYLKDPVITKSKDPWKNR